MGPDDAVPSAPQASGSSAASGGRTLAGRYRLGPTLGTGSYTKSFDAIDLEDSSPVVVKMLPSQFGASASFMERFHRDLAVVRELEHPNIARLLHVGVEEVGAKAYPFLVTEQLAGGSLRGFLDRGRQLTASQVLLVGLDTCRGLAHAHAKGLVHGSVTPANLLFGLDRKVRIADFGISRLLSDIRWANPGRIDIDSARYASPEHVLNLPIEPKSDVYSLCLTLVESVTGQVPFAADTAVSTLSARLDKLMPVSADLGALASVLERAGRPAIEDRFTALELGRALVAAAEKMPRPEPIAIIGLGRFGETTATLPRIGDDTAAVFDVEATAVRDTDADAEAMTLLAQVPDATDELGIAAGSLAFADDIRADDEAGDAPTGEVPVLSAAPVDATSATEYADAVEQYDEYEQHDLYEQYDQQDQYDQHDQYDLYGQQGQYVESDDLGGGGYYADSTDPQQRSHSTFIAGEVEAVAADWTTEPGPLRRTAAIEMVEGDDDVLNIDRRSLVRYLVAALALVAVAAVGVVVFRWLSTPSHEVPSLIGVSEAEATNLVASNGWELDIRRARDDSQPQGNVVSTDPAAGERLKEGESITLVVSDGPTLSPLPDVTNTTIDEARAALTAAGLVLREAKRQASDTVPEGTVISWSVPEQPALAAGSQVPKGTTVEVVVSAGSASRIVPNVVGAAVNDALAQIEAAGLVAGETTEQRSATVPVGTVISVSPNAGATVPFGSTVSLTVSTGP